MTCPFCNGDEPELISQFGSQLLLSQYRCRACGTYFEGLREPPGADPSAPPPPEPSEVSVALSVSAERARRAVRDDAAAVARSSERQFPGGLPR